MAVAELVFVRRMVRCGLILLMFCDSLAAADAPVKVSVRQLLATPERFLGKRIDVTGWYLTTSEDSNLFASESAVDGNLDHSIWLELDIWDPRYYPRRPPGVADFKRVENRSVRVVGTFHYQPRPYLGKTVPYERRFQGFGSYRLNKRAILNITYIQPLH